MLEPAAEALDGPFELGAEIGSGAIATVYRARSMRPACPDAPWLAAKILHPRHERDPDARQRFEREANLARQLRHENIVAVHGTTLIGERSALLMELVEGPTLADFLARSGPLDESTLIPLVRGVASGLALAHSSGVIHRDLKPANVLLSLATSPIPKIADFGMARAASFASADRRAMTVLGTPPYMAPESLDPLAVDPRTDLYALGCIIFELATGAPPFSGATPFAVLDAHRNADIPSLPEGFSPALAALVHRLLAKAPGERPQSAAAVVDALDHLRDAPPGSLVPAAAAGLALTNMGLCSECGSEVLPELRVCFRCGSVLVVVEPGNSSVAVVGPGKDTHRFDTDLQNRLLAWLRANAAVGLDPGPLERTIPRLSFLLVSGLSYASAQTVVSALEKLGVNAETFDGGHYAHPGIRKSGRGLAFRMMAIVGSVCAVPMILNPFLGVFVTAPGLAIAFPFVYFWARSKTSRPMVLRTSQREQPLPPAFKHQLQRLYGMVPAIDLPRHRDALRAVVHRTVALTRDLPSHEQLEVDPEMAHAVNLASVAALRMNELDRAMEREDFDPASPEHRGLMHERDTWSARLLDLTATLDALAARRASAMARLGERDEEDLLAALRSTVESLEEVQRL